MMMANIGRVRQYHVVGGLRLLSSKVPRNDPEALRPPKCHCRFGKRLVQLDPRGGFYPVFRKGLEKGAEERPRAEGWIQKTENALAPSNRVPDVSRYVQPQGGRSGKLSPLIARSEE